MNTQVAASEFSIRLRELGLHPETAASLMESGFKGRILNGLTRGKFGMIVIRSEHVTPKGKVGSMRIIIATNEHPSRTFAVFHGIYSLE